MTAESDDEIKLTFQQRQLTLECGQQSLDKLIAALRAQVSTEQWQQVDESAIKMILIASPPRVRGPMTWQSRLGGIGCFIAAMAVLTIFVAGIVTIVGLLLSLINPQLLAIACY